jgi:hypothetical protein
MSRVKEVDLRVELSKSSYLVGEIVRGSVKITTTCPVVFKSATILWRSIIRVRGDKELLESDMQLFKQTLSELTDHTLIGAITLPLEWEVAKETPATIDMDLLEGIAVTTDLIVTLEIGDPFNDTITKSYPVKIVERPKYMGGVLQCIEFPLNCCVCFGAGDVSAQVELAKTHCVAGDTLKATIIVDLTKASCDLQGASIGLRREVRCQDWGVDSHSTQDLFEGPRSGVIPAGRKTVLTVKTLIPNMAFAPDLNTATVKIKHSALVLFYCPFGWKVETEINVSLVHPEVIKSSEEDHNK